MNPFGALMGFTELLTQDYDNLGDEKRKELIKMINVSSDRIHELLENLLKWARSQTGKLKVNKTRFRISDIIAKNITVFEPLMSQKQISYKTFVPVDLEIFADADMVSTIIRNLLSNAIKFTPRGGEITISVEKEAREVKVMVTDTGTGIPEEIGNTMFETVREETQLGTEGEKGFGLGLLICKEFAEKNGGKMNLHSKVGKGSTFILTLHV